MKIKKRQITVHGRLKWQIDFGVVDGKRPRKVFDTEKEADNEIAEFEKKQKKIGDAWLRVPRKELDELIVFWEILRKEGVTPQQVWDGFREWQKLQEAKPVNKSVSYREAVDTWREEKLGSGKDERYVEDSVALLQRFGEGREEQPIEQFPAGELREWIAAQKWGLSTKKSNMGRFASLWTVAVRHGWVSENIVERLEPIGKLRVTVEIFNHQSCRKLMAASLANTVHQRVIAPLALGLFCGMRPEEIDHPRFGWHLIDLEHAHIEIPAEVAKDGDQRTVTLLPVAVAWLKLALKLKNPLPPVNERKLIDSCCELARITHWPHDVLRKTCATHLRNHYENDWHVIKDLGNSMRILLKHYADLKVPASVSKQHWKLTPDVAKEAVKELGRPETQSAQF